MGDKELYQAELSFKTRTVHGLRGAPTPDRHTGSGDCSKSAADAVSLALHRTLMQTLDELSPEELRQFAQNVGVCLD